MSKNTHLEHLEDDILNDGSVGATNAIGFLEELGRMLSQPTSNINITTKWDGAPAIVCGIDPERKRFFVGTKSVFAKTKPKLCFSDDMIDAWYQGQLNQKLKDCLKYLPELGITGVLQGDLLFTDDKKKEIINGESVISFTPNTITYAVPVDSDLGTLINGAKVGIVFHTTYTGTSMEEMTANFNKISVSSTGNVYAATASFEDASGAAEFSSDEIQKFNALVNRARGSITKASTFLDVLGETGYGRYLLSGLFKQFFNSYIRRGEKIINVRQKVIDFNGYYESILDKHISTLKTTTSKAKYRTMQQDGLEFLNKNSQSVYFTIATYINLQEAKKFVIRKLEKVKTLGTFLKTENGYKVTAPEGFVAIKSGKALKLVDRLEFSRANFTADKEWETGNTLYLDKPLIGTTGTNQHRSVAITFGRFNPPTIGHQKLLNQVKKVSSNYRIYTSHTQDKKKNPLSSASKVSYMKKMFPVHASKIMYNTSLKTIIHVLKDLEKNYEEVALIVGSDRVREMRTLIEKYNNKEYSFKSLKVVSAGQRDPDAEGVGGMSASKMRTAAQKEDFKSFRQGISKNLDDKETRNLMNEVRRGMGLA